jgi:hypothetical protein
MALKFTTLTRASIRQLAPGKKLTEHGITVERSQSGDAVYRVRP